MKDLTLWEHCAIEAMKALIEGWAFRHPDQPIVTCHDPAETVTWAERYADAMVALIERHRKGQPLPAMSGVSEMGGNVRISR